MDSPAMTVRAKYMGSNKKGPAMPGVLTMSDAKLRWVPNDPRSSNGLEVDCSIIKAHFFNKENPKNMKALLNLSKGTDAKADGFVFEFDNFQDRDLCRDLVAKILGKQVRNVGVPVAPKQAPSTLPGEPFDRAEMERRLKLLQEDSGLQKLHQQLVIGGVLSETEFWAARKHMRDDEDTRTPKQRTGLKSAMLAEVPLLADGRTNKVTFSLTPEIIHQIFAEKPAVHRAFLMNVPTKMTEIEFWTKYCRAEYLYRTKNAAAAAAEAADDEDLAVFTKDDDIIASEAQRKIRKVDPTLDMAADLADDYLSLPGHGVLRDGNKENMGSTDGRRKRTIMHDINRHAAVVLEGRPLDAQLKDTATVAQALALAQQVDAEAERADVDFEKRRMERVHQMTLNDDLDGPHLPPHVPLCIQDPRKYFDAQQAGVAGDSSTEKATAMDPAEALDSFHEQLAAFKSDRFKDLVILPDVALKVLNDLTLHITTTKYTLGKIAEKNILDNLPRQLKDDLLQNSATVNELLRHFWAAYPLTSSFLLTKVNRLKEAMGTVYNKIQVTKDSAPPEFRHQISQLVQPTLQALDAAFAHYDLDAQKRAAKNALKTRTGA